MAPPMARSQVGWRRSPPAVREEHASEPASQQRADDAENERDDPSAALRAGQDQLCDRTRHEAEKDPSEDSHQFDSQIVHVTARISAGDLSQPLGAFSDNGLTRRVLSAIGRMMEP